LRRFGDTCNGITAGYSVLVKILLSFVFVTVFAGSVCFGNFKAIKITYTVSGSTGIGGVLLKGLPGNPVSDENGNYSVTVDYGWHGSVFPASEGHVFVPESRSYSKVVGDQFNQDYSGSLIRHSISGVITFEGDGLEGVLVTAGDGAGSATSDDKGEYTIFVDYGFSGSVSLEKEGYAFEHGKGSGKTFGREYKRVREDYVEQNYDARILVFNICGTINVGGEPVEGVTMNAGNGGGSFLTGADGKYSLTVDYGWSGEVSPSKAGYTFDPPSIAYENVTSDIDEDVKDAEREAARKKAEEVAAVRKAAEKVAAARKKAKEVAAARKAAEEVAALEKVAAPGEKSVAEKPAKGDVSERETELDIRIVSMNRSDLAGMKFEWVAPKNKSGIVAGLQEKKVDEPGESAKWPLGIQIGCSLEADFSGTAGGILADLAKSGKASIVSSPKVLTRDGETTEIKVTAEKGYVSKDDSAEVDDSETQKNEYQTVLNITPEVLPSGDIMLSLVIEISEVAILGENSQVVSRRVANNTVRIKDGGTILVASLNNDDGGADDSENVNEDVAIFVTGRLLPD